MHCNVIMRDKSEQQPAQLTLSDPIALSLQIEAASVDKVDPPIETSSPGKSQSITPQTLAQKNWDMI